MMGRGKDKVSKKARVNPKTVTEFSEGKVKPTKRGKRNNSGSKSGRVTTSAPHPDVVAKVNEIKKTNPNVKVRWNRDGSADITNG